MRRLTLRRLTSRPAAAVVCLTGISLLIAAAAVRVQQPDSAAAALVEAERAFSRLAGKIGYVPAFLAYFADDVMTFQPAPGLGKDRLRETAARMPVPPTVKADWEPWFAGAARAGDLGYTTGPSVFTEAATGSTP